MTAKKNTVLRRKSPGSLTWMLKEPGNLHLSMKSLARGIDNYRVDVLLSPQFVFQLGDAIDEVLLRAIDARSPLPTKHALFEALRSSYKDMMSTLIHRTKTDLSAQQILFLQFAVAKLILQQVRRRLDRNIERRQESASQQKSSGSAKMLHTHEQIVSLRKKYNSILYRTNQQIFKMLYRVELSHLRDDRKDCLGKKLSHAVDVLFNPMLHAHSPEDDELLFDQYALWNDYIGGFGDLNGKWEQMMRGYSSIAAVNRIRSGNRVEAKRTAVFDELGGLFALQALLGTVEEQRDTLRESLSWMEAPENIRILFDQSRDEERAFHVRKTLGLIALWRFSRQRRKADKLFKTVTRYLNTSGKWRTLLASYELRQLWRKSLADIFEPGQLADLIAGTATKKTLGLMEELMRSNKMMAKQVQAAAKKVNVDWKENSSDKVIQILTDLSRYRLHLKYYRFAHRIFNRISILTSEKDIALSRQGNQLYSLLGAAEVEEVKSKIVHHTIVKADVRGSTTVTSELVNQKLNPASYFSQRFFDPINVLLQTYGAGKVFIEGDAVILSLMEYDDTPQHWYSISRACGLAKEIIQVVASSNTFSERTGLPNLEIGIGICYSDEAPLFLLEEGKQIMISTAIGDADRMSSCSWKMREKYRASLFNVEVCRLAEGEGEKGQHHVRYNVNGISLDEEAMKKLKSEIMLQKLTMNIAGEDAVFHAGRFPDVHGKNRDLVIRQAKMGIWKNEQVVHNRKSGGYFYEVVTNAKVLARIGEMMS